MKDYTKVYELLSRIEKSREWIKTYRDRGIGDILIYQYQKDIDRCMDELNNLLKPLEVKMVGMANVA